MVRKVAVLAAGGSGGHVYPAQGLAEKLLERGWKVILITDQRGIVYTKEFPKQVKKLVLKLKNPSSGYLINYVVALWLILKSVISVLSLYSKAKASIVVGFGGYPTAPSLLAATIARIPIAIHEQNAVLGKVNRIFRRTAKFLAFGLETSEFLKNGDNILVSGNPVRKSILSFSPTNYSELNQEIFCILVLGGSQGATFVSKTACKSIIKVAKRIERKITVFHQCRKEEIDSIEKLYSSEGIEAITRSFYDNICEQISMSNLVITRSGASTLAELCHLARPSILIPLPGSARDHQRLNAATMESEGAAIVLEQIGLNAEKLSSSIEFLINDQSRCIKMAYAAQGLARRDAAEVLADQLEKLRQRKN